MMTGVTVEPTAARAEDRATVGTDPSADPGARTEGPAAYARCRQTAARVVARLSPFGTGAKAINPSRRSRERCV